MAYLALLWKARTIENYRLKYEKEKINSILTTNTELPRNTLYQKWTLYRMDSQKRLERICRNWHPEGSKIANWACLKENSSILLRIVIGIVGGIFLTYFSYKIFVLELAIWSIMSWVIGVVITLGLAFSYRVRCLVLLLIPGLFSRVGRYTLACYALVLILTGPANNTIKNLDILSESLACGQEQIKTSVNLMEESKDSPLNLVRETMSGTVEKIKYLAVKMKGIMVKTHRLTISIAHVLQSSLSWLNSVETACNAKLGTPYDHCIKTLFQGSEGLKEFPQLSRQFNLDVVVQAICFTLKPAEPLCIVGDFAKGSIIATVKKKLTTFFTRIQSLLSVAVHIRRSHSCCSNGSQPISQSAAGIVTDLRNRADPLLTWLSWSCTLTGLFLLLIIFRAKYYQFMFRTRSRFDNRYITKELRELDLKRQRQGRETVLPLNTRERAKYVSTASCRLLPSERLYLARSIVFMVITTFKLMIHMVADYSLYWMLMNIRTHGNAQTSSQPTNRTVNISVKGSGPLAATVRMLIEAISVPLVLPELSPTTCLPNPNPPDLQRYAQIGTLILLLWLLALFEPYGLRLRHVITGHYQPERAKARAVWLYYHIIRTRSCFLKYARRKLHRQYKYTSEEKLTFKRWLSGCIPCRWLRTLLGLEPKEPRCLLCYTKHRQDDPDRHLKTCETPSCPGVYCSRCFVDIGQLCTICYSPQDYGDLSDVSLERFSSDDSSYEDTDDEGDDKPLLGTLANTIKGNENGTQTNKNKRKKHSRPSSKNDNQESIKLLDCDYLNKDYSQESKPCLKSDKAYKLEKFDEISAQCKVSRIKSNRFDSKDENITNKEFWSNKQVSYLYDETAFPKDLEIIVKGLTIPKRKQASIVSTMALLTTKVNDEEYVKYGYKFKHTPFVSHMVMEMSQPLELLKRLSLSKHIRCAKSRCHTKNKELNETCIEEIPFLVTDVMLPTKVSITSPDLSTVSILKTSEPIKHVQDHSQEKGKIEKFIKRKNNKRSRKRNMKRYLEIKKIIATQMIKLRKRRIHFNKLKFSRKRRRRRRKRYLYFSLIRITSKTFSSKTTENGRSDRFKNYNNIKANRLSLDTIKQRKYIQQDTKRLANNEILVMHEAELYLKNNAYNLSNIATVDSCDVPSANTMNDTSLFKELNEVNSIELEKRVVHKTTHQKIQQPKKKKLSFWAYLRLRILGNQSRAHPNITKKEPLLNKPFTNRKRRKKLKTNDTVEKNPDNFNARQVDDDARNYRISVYIKDQEWETNGIVDEKNNEMPLLFEPKTNTSLVKETKRRKQEEIKNKKREIKLRLSNEAKLRKKERKEQPAKEKRNEHHGAQSTGEIIYLYENSSAGKDFGFIKILKTISKTALNLSNFNGYLKSCSKEEIIKEHNKDTRSRGNITENLQRQMNLNEEFPNMKNSEYEHGTLTELRLDDFNKLVCNCDNEWEEVPIAHELSQTARSHDSNKPNELHRSYQADSKLEKETNNRDTNILSAAESSKNSKEIQENLSKFYEVNRSVNAYETELNISELHYYESLINLKSCKSKINSIKDKLMKHACKYININSKEEVREEDLHVKRQICPNINMDDEHSNYKDSTSIMIKNKDSNEPIASSDHVYQAVPIKHSFCQTDETYDHTIRRGFNRRVKGSRPEKVANNTNTRITISPSLIKPFRNTKGVQASVCNKCQKNYMAPFETEKNIIKIRENKEVTVYPDQLTRESQCEKVSQMSRETQLERNVKNDETQCLPTVTKWVVQSTGVETENPITYSCASQYSSYRNVGNRDANETLPYSESMSSQVTIEYTNEKSLKKRVNLTTTTNQSVTTETKTADVSTLTSDWWSPMAERKEKLRKSYIDMKREDNMQEGMCRGAPSLYKFLENTDALSASKYLLQSEKYECPNQVYPVEFGSSQSQWSFSRFQVICKDWRVYALNRDEWRKTGEAFAQQWDTSTG